MKTISMLFLLCILTACGSASADDPGKAGIFFPDVVGELKTIYAAAQECAGLKGDSFENLHIEFVSKFFSCPDDASKLCVGRYDSPNRVTLLYIDAFQHEAIHHLFYINFGQSDSGHTDPVWQKDCAKI